MSKNISEHKKVLSKKSLEPKKSFEQKKVLSKISPASSSLCPVLTRPTLERICSFLGEKKPRLFFQYTDILPNPNPNPNPNETQIQIQMKSKYTSNLTEEHPTGQTALFQLGFLEESETFFSPDISPYIFISTALAVLFTLVYSVVYIVVPTYLSRI